MPEGAPQQFCLWTDYRKLCSLLPAVTPVIGTKKGTFALMPLPKIDELFALLKGSKYFTALDLWSGYYHIKLDEESIPESAFTTVYGKFEFLRLPFGLSQCLDFFIHLMYDLSGLDKISMQGQGSGYIDIFRGHSDLQDWKRTPWNVTNIYSEPDLKIKLSKWSFFK